MREKNWKEVLSMVQFTPMFEIVFEELNIFVTSDRLLSYENRISEKVMGSIDMGNFFLVFPVFSNVMSREEVKVIQKKSELLLLFKGWNVRKVSKLAISRMISQHLKKYI